VESSPSDESFDVKIWAIKKLNRPKPYLVRWVVGKPPEFNKTFLSKLGAEAYRGRLLTARSQGEPFSLTTGEPVSWARAEEKIDDKPAITWYQHALDYADMKWPEAAANSRAGIAESLAIVTAALVSDVPNPPSPDALRAALYGWAFNPPRRTKSEPTAQTAGALAWLEEASLPLTALNNAKMVRRALTALSLKKDGTKAAAKTYARKRATFSNALGYAVELELLAGNPLARVKLHLPKTVETVDRQVVANPRQVRAMLARVREARPDLVAFFGCLYFAAMRPAEVVNLRAAQCVLPASGWGQLNLAKSSPRAGSAWTDTGDPYDERSLKHRADGETRPVPIPPELVRLLREHIDTFGTATDGRLFQGRRGGRISESVYGPVWAGARSKALGQLPGASERLAQRPYDLRHGGVSLWLNNGVPPAEVAERAGHSVHVLLRVYAKCIDGQQGAVNKKIDDALGDDRDGPRDVASEGDDDPGEEGIEPPPS
jgi:integrase